MINSGDFFQEVDMSDKKLRVAILSDSPTIP